MTLLAHVIVAAMEAVKIEEGKDKEVDQRHASNAIRRVILQDNAQIMEIRAEALIETNQEVEEAIIIMTLIIGTILIETNQDPNQNLFLLKGKQVKRKVFLILDLFLLKNLKWRKVELFRGRLHHLTKNANQSRKNLIRDQKVDLLKENLKKREVLVVAVVSKNLKKVEVEAEASTTKTKEEM